ncbi:uncharacterized protein LOC129876792 [Solanum dulcamara]|uniref:uncharacterized protein LOC129876792 n=1 Tax=Solanum dulcamara TaxID=45834 RepID=UPI002486A994|nr:uncharacterized protein LOC129876792 [Solanum dulcamara]
MPQNAEAEFEWKQQQLHSCGMQQLQRPSTRGVATSHSILAAKSDIWDFLRELFPISHSELRRQQPGSLGFHQHTNTSPSSSIQQLQQLHPAAQMDHLQFLLACCLVFVDMCRYFNELNTSKGLINPSLEATRTCVQVHKESNKGRQQQLPYSQGSWNSFLVYLWRCSNSSQGCTTYKMPFSKTGTLWNSYEGCNVLGLLWSSLPTTFSNINTPQQQLNQLATHKEHGCSSLQLSLVVRTVGCVCLCRYSKRSNHLKTKTNKQPREPAAISFSNLQIASCSTTYQTTIQPQS